MPLATIFSLHSTNHTACFRISLEGMATFVLSLPELEETEFVTFSVQHRTNPQQLANATRRKNVFLSNDSGTPWRQIMHYGP
jgi:hypothetical protein